MSEYRRVCKECKIDKPIFDFYKQSECRGGARPTCKECMKKNQRLYYKNTELCAKHEITCCECGHKESLTVTEFRERAKHAKDSDKNLHKVQKRKNGT